MYIFDILHICTLERKRDDSVKYFTQSHDIVPHCQKRIKISKGRLRTE